jgi:hypothetical protein
MTHTRECTLSNISVACLTDLQLGAGALPDTALRSEHGQRAPMNAGQHLRR